MSKKSHKQLTITAIVWTGDMRRIPGIGIVSRGLILYIPNNIDIDRATAFIRQGLARNYKDQNTNDSNNMED